MDTSKKKPLVKYNIQKLNDVIIGDSYIKKIAQTLKNFDLNRVNESTEVIWNKTKETMINSAIEILGIEPRGNNKYWFNDICKNVIT